MSDDVGLDHRLALRETLEAKLVHVEARSPFEDPLRDQLADRGSLHESVATEAIRQHETPQTCRRTQHRIVIGSGLVEARPSVGDLRLLQGGQSPNRRLHDAWKEVPIDSGVES